MKTLSSCSNSSAKASFKASRTVYWLPDSEAYDRIEGRVAGANLCTEGRNAEGADRCEISLEAGRKSLAAAIVINDLIRGEAESRVAS